MAGGDDDVLGGELLAPAIALVCARSALDDNLIAETARRIATIRVSPEGHEGMSAFLEKRMPSWRKKTTSKK